MGCHVHRPFARPGRGSSEERPISVLPRSRSAVECMLTCATTMNRPGNDEGPGRWHLLRCCIGSDGFYKVHAHLSVRGHQ